MIDLLRGTEQTGWVEKLGIKQKAASGLDILFCGTRCGWLWWNGGKGHSGENIKNLRGQVMASSDGSGGDEESQLPKPLFKKEPYPEVKQVMTAKRLREA